MRSTNNLQLICVLVLLQFFSARLSSAQEGVIFQGELNEDNINVRADSTVSARTICALKKGEIVEVLRESYGWYKIRLPHSAPSFIKKDFLLSIDNKTARVLKNNVNIRLGPDTSSVILGKANTGDVVNILEKNGDWLKIDPIPNSFGWINKNFVNRIENRELVSGIKAGVQGDKEEIIVEGIIRPKVFTRVATHKLIDLEKTYLLKGDKAYLDSFIGRKVKVSAKIIDPAMQKYPILAVEKIEAITQ